jgi:helix-turn-helix protein
MLDVLMDGAAHSATELANEAQVAPSTASAHLSALAEGGLVSVEPRGRERRFRLAGPEVARALEALARIAPALPVASSLRRSTARAHLAAGRTCYDHLAGRLGVAVADGLMRRGALAWRAGAFIVLDRGKQVLSGLGIGVDEFNSRRPLVLACLDWTEDRPHISGALGSAVRDLLFASGSIRRRRGTRAVAVTDSGADWLREHIGVDFVG